MLSLPVVRVFLSTVPADMRRFFDGLTAWTPDLLRQNPLLQLLREVGFALTPTLGKGGEADKTLR